MKNKLIEAAILIKNWCATKGVYDEKECPFFKGHIEENGIKTIQCELNKDKLHHVIGMSETRISWRLYDK